MDIVEYKSELSACLEKCPGCGLEHNHCAAIDSNYNATASCLAYYHALTAFTLSLGDPGFIHQVAYDSYAAQHAGAGMKPITLAFSLIGLYLVCEEGYSGREVQRAHMKLGKVRREWTVFSSPAGRGAMTVKDVLAGIDGENCNRQIMQWAKSVWETWSPAHETIKKLAQDCLK